MAALKPAWLAGILALALLAGWGGNNGAVFGAEAADNQAPQLPAKPAPFFISPEKARQIEKENSLPLSGFYDTGDLPKGKPGDLIRTEECSDYRFPSGLALKPSGTGMKVARFLYFSESSTGRPVPASGVIVIPYGDPSAGGWPVVVWAHGTSGVGRPFAPSLMKDLHYNWEGLLEWAMLGYAVIAPDYAGLGTNVRHEYLAAEAQAQDVINAVPAARKAVKELGERWVAIGHSQGGGAVLVVAEKQSLIKDPNYLGVVSLAPAGDLVSVLEHLGNSSTRGYIGFLAYGIQSVYPDFNYGDFLTPEAVKLMPEVPEGGWLVTLASFAEKIPAGKVLKPNWTKNRHFQKFRELSVLGERPTHGPILLLQGEADQCIPTHATDALYERMKRQKSQVEYRKYPGLDHMPLMFGSFRDQVRWVQDRFAARTVANNVVAPMALRLRH